MILTEIPTAALPHMLSRFAGALDDRHARAAFRRIAASGAARAAGARAEAHRLAAGRLGRRLGIAVRPGAPARSFGWDGRIMRGGTEAYVLLHEIAHWQLANARRRRAFEFALGPGPETGHRAAAARAALLTGLPREGEEAMASLLGILWEVELHQPALASLLDQNWLEGAGRPGAARHFERVLAALYRHGLVDRHARPRRCTVPYPCAVGPPSVNGHGTRREDGTHRR
ncbi:MAG: hypothetical protein ACREFD_12555 [Stellaceae bacterium]